MLTIGAFSTISALALKLKYLNNLTGEVVGTTIVVSLLAIMLHLTLAYKYDGSVYSCRMESNKNIPAFILFIVMIVLIILAVTMLVFMLMGKFKSKA